MNRVRRLIATDGSEVVYSGKVIASGQKKDCCLGENGSYVVLWFRDELKESDIDRLQAVIGPYRDRLFEGAAGKYWKQLMCWPDRIVTDGQRIGITAPRYPDNFFFEHGSQNNDSLGLKGKEKQGYWFASLKHRSRTLDPRELGDWRTALRMALLISRALRRIHAAGLVHGDLSYKNIILDPPRGNACLIDLDGIVVPDKYPPDVIGTPDFIAPEIVATRHLPRNHPDRKLPDWRTDLHALAVLNYLLLLLRHPLRGDRIHDLDDDERQESLLMGAGALFIEHPTQQENRICLDFLEPYELPWKNTGTIPYQALGPYLAPLVERAFIEGLQAPALRPTAQDWETALLSTADLLHPCENRVCSAKWFPLDTQKMSCPFCGTRITTPVYVIHSYIRKGGTFVPSGKIKILHHHTSLFPWHIHTGVVPSENLAPEASERIAFVACAEGRMWLMNEGIPDFMDAENKTPVPPGEAIELTANQTLIVDRNEPAHLWWIDQLQTKQ